MEKLSFFITPEHPCSYLPDRRAVTLFADPRYPKNKRLYSTFAHKGFRRSGEYLYKPSCNGCRACIPVRIPVNEFRPRRSQVRCWKRNRDLTIVPVAAEYLQTHFDLYCRYIARRHPGSSMDKPRPEDYMNFLTASWMDSVFFEMKRGDQLLGVAVIDVLNDGLSAVYTFYDTDYPGRSLGTFAILHEIEEAKRLGLNWLYLGYWIRDCKKMSYKTDFQPLEYYRNNVWHRTTA